MMGEAPPRSRRSTLHEGRDDLGRAGSSALAEIDPQIPPAAWDKVGLLRARGDRPLRREDDEALAEAPPRSRRSTRTAVGRELLAQGSSALAEIDPKARRRWPSRGRLLRARGDRPTSGSRPTTSRGAPPRSRRSTRSSGGTTRPPGGSSALAEIDPHEHITEPLDRRLLRARGDRPSTAMGGPNEHQAPPRSRRSTRSIRFDA